LENLNKFNFKGRPMKKMWIGCLLAALCVVSVAWSQARGDAAKAVAALE
jgi:hypothetical protein